MQENYREEFQHIFIYKSLREALYLDQNIRDIEDIICSNLGLEIFSAYGSYALERFC